MAHTFKLKNLLLWHRRFGVVSALFVLLLCVSGILLNHSHSFGLDTKHIQHPLLLKLYGIQPPELISTQAASVNASQLNNQIFINGKYWHNCNTALIGAITDGTYIFVACSANIALFTLEGELVDVLDTLSGVPSVIDKVGICDQQSCVFGDGQYWAFDINRFSFVAMEPANMHWAARVVLPPEDEQRLRGRYTGATVSFTRLVQDIHAGRFLGALGPLIMDAVALLFILLSVSGVWIWLRKSR